MSPPATQEQIMPFGAGENPQTRETFMAPEGAESRGTVWLVLGLGVFCGERCAV